MYRNFLFDVLVLSCFLPTTLSQDGGCGPSRSCGSGCCSRYGYCGFGPDYCSTANCVATCDAKTECNPGYGAQWAMSDKCPLNVCCSQYGFCGTTSDFCGNSTVKSPSCGGTPSNQRTIGYYEGWSVSRKCDTMAPEEIPVGAYTHLNFAFASIDPSSFVITPTGPDQIDLYNRTTALKQQDPSLKVWISVGGWSMNDPNQTTFHTYSNLVASKGNQKAFADSLISFMQGYGFDGVDIDWEYPVAPERGGSSADLVNYVTFLQNLRQALDASGRYGLSITLPASYYYMQRFDIVNISKTIDWFNVMTYDLHGTWDATDPSSGNIVQAHTNLTEIDQTLQLLWRNSITPAQVVLGLGFYGRTFTLSDPSCTAPGCPFSGAGKAGPCTNSAGTLSYTEIERVVSAGGEVGIDRDAAVEQVVWDGDQWASYDDADTFAMKIDYANRRCLGGTMVWAVSLDARGTAASALSRSTGRRAVAQGGDRRAVAQGGDRRVAAAPSAQTQISGASSLKAPRLL